MSTLAAHAINPNFSGTRSSAGIFRACGVEWRSWGNAHNRLRTSLVSSVPTQGIASEGGTGVGACGVW